MATSSKNKKKKIRQQVKPQIKAEVKDTTNEKLNTFNDKLADKARKLLVASQIYKQDRMNTLAIYERLYNNDVLPKLRQMFNTVIPIFSGMIDELLAMFNDDIDLKFKARNPAQELVVPKIQSHFNAESKSLLPNASWGYKGRVGRFNAVISGRMIHQIYAYNEPKYTNVLLNINYSDFHCEPLGGGILENHSFVGKEGCFKSIDELKNDEKYDKAQVEKLENFAYTDDMFVNLETTYGTRFARWKALGFNIEANAFTGENVYNLCEFIITEDDGERYLIVFEPCTGLWLSVEPWKDRVPSGLYPYKSAATHEDDKNFWSKSYADDFFTVADAVLTLFNQELTNREKKNYNARAFDKDMFPDVAKLDAAQYRPDALVPANTMGGTKRIADGLYAFDTPQLQGTINLIDWMSGYVGNKTGAEEAPASGGRKTVSVMLAQQQKQSKRVGLRSDSFQQMYMELGYAYVEGLREYMEPRVSVQIVGENGFIEEQELTRIEVKEAGAFDISVASDNEQESQDQMKKEAKAKAIGMVAENPNLTPFEKEVIYRDVGGFSESDIIFLLDKQGDLTRKQYANASQAIQDILLGNTPDIYYGADSSYLKYVHQYIVDNKGKIKGKEKNFMDFLSIMEPIVTENMKMVAALQPQPAPDQKDPNGGGGNPAPAPQQNAAKQKVTLPAVAQKMGAAA